MRGMAIVLVVVILVQGSVLQGAAVSDSFSMIMEKMKTVTASNCRSKSMRELQLQTETVAQVPMYNKLFSDTIHVNRSTLLHLHNNALNRAFYYSFLYQRLGRSSDFEYQPDLLHQYMSSTADVSANQGWIDGSALMFDKNCSYPNWMPYLDFNRTLSLFGVRSWTGGDKIGTKWAREPINATNEELISGLAFQEDPDKNYTYPAYKFCPYTRYNTMFWWPDSRGYRDSLRKWTYSVGIKFSDTTGKFKSNYFEGIRFFGPAAGTRDLTLPVLMTPPYFDCGRSNRWIVSMTSPVTEVMTRYTFLVHLSRPR